LQSLLNDFSEKPESLDIAQYALDLSLVHKEFSGFKRLSEERMHVLINFCCALSRHARAEQWRYSRPYFDHPHIKYIA